MHKFSNQLIKREIFMKTKILLFTILFSIAPLSSVMGQIDIERKYDPNEMSAKLN